MFIASAPVEDVCLSVNKIKTSFIKKYFFLNCKMWDKQTNFESYLFGYILLQNISFEFNFEQTNLYVFCC
jgi:hypothetical protein